MMKQFGRIVLTVVGLAVAAAVLSSIPVRASGPSRFVTANGLAGAVNFVDTSNPADTVMGNVQVGRMSNTTYFLNYNISDGAAINDSSFGSIPASSVNVSGGTVKGGKTVLTLNVNTCDFPELIANGQGPCGTFNLIWTEQPGSFQSSSRENIVIVFPPSQQFPEGQKQVITGEVVGDSALVTGTALTYSNTGGPAFGEIDNQKDVIKTFTIP